MKLLSQIHARFGDFWWYTGLQFVASRCGDLINAFIGLWLVPKYVGMEELGAVLPLASFALAIAFPLSAFTGAFNKQVNVLTLNREWGKLKTLLRGVFIAGFLFVVLGVLAVKLCMPWVLERVRVAKGALGVAIIASSLLCSVAPVYLNTLQSMKRFKAVSLINLFGAPIRLVAMLVAMPIRALTGYFVGQSAGPAFQAVASVIALRKELGPLVKAETFWTRPMVVWFFRYMGLIALGGFAGMIVSFVEPLIIRQRLPELDSAAYYMISRFAEVGSYFGMTLSLIVFPYASESAEKGCSDNGLIVKSMVGSVGFGVLCAIGFGVVGRIVLRLLPNGESFVGYVPELVALTLILAAKFSIVCFVNAESAACRFTWLWWMIPVNVVYAASLYVLTGCEYFRGVLPDVVVDALVSVHAGRLDFLLGMMGLVNFLQIGFIVIHLVGRWRMSLNRIAISSCHD